MKQYKFVRYMDKMSKKISEWVFFPETKEDVIDFNTLYTAKICENGFSNVVKSVIENGKRKNPIECEKRFFFGDHPSTYYEQAFQSMAMLPKEESTIVDVADNLYNSVCDSRISSFDKGHKMLLGSDGIKTLIYIPEYEEIVDEIYVDKLEFPDIIRPTYRDVRYLQWPDGHHWYAKIGNKDVYVDGKMKWNTHYEAEKAAMKFIKENY